MARVIGQIESLKSLRSELDRRNIYMFNSIGEINKFKRNYDRSRQQIIQAKKESVEQEIQTKSDALAKHEEVLLYAREITVRKLDEQLAQHKTRRARLLQKKADSSGLLKWLLAVQAWWYDRKALQLTRNYAATIDDKLRELKEPIDQLTNDIKYLTEHREKEIRERSKPELHELTEAMKAVKELGPLIAGAIGESKVEQEIRKLSDDFILINDYRLEFEYPVYNMRTKDRIHSIQLDHLVVSRAGIFILETKNWSKESIRSLDLRSPVEQIIRSSFALKFFVNKNIELTPHHWGERAIPIYNVVVMIHAKPKEEFKYVKIRLLDELNSYLQYFEPTLSREDLDILTDGLISHANQD